MPLNNFGRGGANVFRSAQPDEDGLKLLADLGVRYILKLNEDSPTEENTCARLGIAVLYMPIPTFINHIDNITSLARELEGLRLQGIVDVHCAHGRDRTGLIVAARRILFDGWSVAEADAERRIYGVEGLIKLGDLDMEFILHRIAGQKNALLSSDTGSRPPAPGL